MRAVVSTTYDDKYLFFLPIITWCWNKLGVDVICFTPVGKPQKQNLIHKLVLLEEVRSKNNLKFCVYAFDCPEHKEATYAQCSRLYAAALDLPEDEVLITSDIDMVVFKVPPYIDWITIYGADLVPPDQFPICYASGKVKDWRTLFDIDSDDWTVNKRRTYQECLDILLGPIEAEHFRGNYWAKDQETLYQCTWESAALMNRAKPGTQFATNRLDRDDAYLLDRLNPDIIDYHMPRPGYEEGAFNQIMTVLKYFYPNDDFQWLIDYKNAYISLL